MVAKRAGAPAGTTVVLRVAGSTPPSLPWSATTAAARLLPERPGAPTVRISTDRETFIVLAGGRRRTRRRRAVAIEGDAELGRRILDGHGDHPVTHLAA